MSPKERFRRWGRPNKLTELFFPNYQFVTTGVFIWALFQGFGVGWWFLAVIMYVLYYGIGLSVSYHRYYSHQSFKASENTRWFMAVTSVLGGHSSGLHWVPIHILHHQNSDHPGDPHSPRMHGWRMLLLKNYPYPDFDKWKLRRYVKKYPELVFTHNNHNYLFFGWLAFLALIDWRLLLFGAVIPHAWTVFASLWLVSGAHLVGRQDHDTGDDSRNCSFVSWLTFGEGLHNNHHYRAGSDDFSLGSKAVDPGYWLVRLLEEKR